MAKFLLQKDKNVLDTETLLLKEALNRGKYLHSYTEASLTKLKESTFDKDLIPVGTIEYVQAYLGNTYGIYKENPIEIPKYLRTEEFLKRDYKIVNWYDVPTSGNYFIKNASKLKDFSYCGEMQYFMYDGIWDAPSLKFDTSLRLSKDDKFVVSSNFKPLSEYRVYVIEHNIEEISHYDGNPLLFPDVELLKKAVSLIEFNEKWLKSYTIDIMVNSLGTAIIEIHNFTSVGLYTTMLGDGLPYAYRDGIDYLINDNKEIEM